MVFWAFFIVLLILILIAAAFLRLSFMILVSFDDQFHLEMKVMLYKILTLYRWNLKDGGVGFLMKGKKDVPKKQKKKKGRLSGILRVLFSKNTFRSFKKNIEVFDVSVKGRLATHDAAHTALLYGQIWGAAGFLIPFIPKKHLILDFYPDFHKEIPDFHVSCILRMRIIHIIVLVIEQKRKEKKRK